MRNLSEDLFWDQLLQLVAEGHVVPIVGRGLLRVEVQGRDALLYPVLAQRLAAYLSVPASDLPEGDELNTIVCRYIETGSRIEDVYTALKIVMPTGSELSTPSALAKLASITPFKLFVTTTFDPLMQRAVDEVRFGGQPRTQVLSYSPGAVEDLPGSLTQLDRPVVFHLLGKLSSIPAYAVTQEDVLEFLHSLQSEGRQPAVLLDELNRTNLLILGCSFGDWLARFFLRTAKRQRLLEPRGSTDYIADATVSADVQLLTFLRHFSSRTRIYESRGAPDFIDELHRRWNERYPAQSGGAAQSSGPAATHGIAGAVFLSYASEDRLAAIKIRDALEAAGVDVFYDKSDLQAGDDFELKLKVAIRESALFVALISSSTLTEQRRFFRTEWNLAFDELLRTAPTERFIIPVVIDDTPPTDPAVPEKLRQLHWEKLTNGEADAEFVTMVRQLFRRYQKTVKTGL